jgi:hypothetical protein
MGVSYTKKPAGYPQARVIQFDADMEGSAML